MPRETVENRLIYTATTWKSCGSAATALLGLTGIVQIPYPRAVWSVEEGYGYSTHTV
jgi:hypothetical protein